jgi:hypothetical protein
MVRREFPMHLARMPTKRFQRFLLREEVWYAVQLFQEGQLSDARFALALSTVVLTLD